MEPLSPIPQDSVLSATESQRFNDLYNKFNEGHFPEALGELKQLMKEVSHPWAKVALLYHEALFLLEMRETSDARDRLEDFKRALASQGAPPDDSFVDDLPLNLAVMALYTEVRVLYMEGERPRALEALDELNSRYPKQLSVPGFEQTRNDLEALRGMLLSEAHRWTEARPYLEKASERPQWHEFILWHLGHCHYGVGEYELARETLLQALKTSLPPKWASAVHDILGRTEFHLGNMESAKRHFEEYVRSADPKRVAESRTFEWLEKTCAAKGLHDESERYRELAKHSKRQGRPN